MSILSPGRLRLLLAITVVASHDSRIGLGKWAVYVFFALSGYWVTLMFRKKYSAYSRPVPAFYLSRYLRLLPVFAVCQALMLGLMINAGADSLAGVGPEWVVRTLLIVGITFQKQFLSPAWSLDIECQFYLALPIVVALLNRIPDARRARNLAAIAGVIFLPLALIGGSDHSLLLSSYLTFFLFGVANAYLPWKPTPLQGRWAAAGFVALLLVLMAVPLTRGMLISGRNASDLYKFNDQISAFLALAFMPCFYYSVSLRSSVADKHLGNTAYSLYLVHWLPHYAVVTGLLSFPSRLLTTGAALGLDVIFCAALYVLVDRPADALRQRTIDRWFRRPTLQRAAEASC